MLRIFTERTPSNSLLSWLFSSLSLLLDSLLSFLLSFILYLFSFTLFSLIFLLFSPIFLFPHSFSYSFYHSLYLPLFTKRSCDSSRKCFRIFRVLGCSLSSSLQYISKIYRLLKTTFFTFSRDGKRISRKREKKWLNKWKTFFYEKKVPQNL